MYSQTIDFVPNIQGRDVSVSRQNDICDFHPQVKCSRDCSSLMVIVKVVLDQM